MPMPGVNPDMSLAEIKVLVNKLIDLVNALHGYGKLVRVVTYNNAMNYAHGFMNEKALEEASWLTNLP
jgi:hypothetical protein